MTIAGDPRAYSLLLLVFLIIIVVLGLDKVPFTLSLNSVLEGTVGIALLVGADNEVVVELVQAHGASDDESVVRFMVVRDPHADEPPEALDEGIAAEASGLLPLSAYENVRNKRLLTQLRSIPEVARSQLGSEWREPLLVEVANHVGHL